MVRVSTVLRRRDDSRPEAGRCDGRSGGGAGRLPPISASVAQTGVEAAVEDRVEGAVDERQRRCEDEHRLRDLVPVLGPDVDQVDDEVGRPADDEQADDGERQTDGPSTCPEHRPRVALVGKPQLDARLVSADQHRIVRRWNFRLHPSSPPRRRADLHARRRRRTHGFVVVG